MSDPGMKRPAPNTTCVSTEQSTSPTATASRVDVPTVPPKKIRFSKAQQFITKLSQMLKPEEAEGPVYPLLNDSFVLYKPGDNEIYDSDRRNGVVPVVVNPHFSGKLKPVQREGLKFLWNSFRENKGCILGHEMGLGKTFTSIVFIWTLLEQSEGSIGKSSPWIKKVIIVAPKGIGEHWKSEFDQWSPSDKKIKIELIDSATKTRDGNLKIEEFETNEKQVLIFSYDNWKKYKLRLSYFKTPIKLVICDEAHGLKNVSTQKSTALRSKLRNEDTGEFSDINLVEIFVGLTGTPYQNNDEELCNLIEFFRPGTLGPEYKENFIKPIKMAESAKNTQKSEEEKAKLQRLGQKKREQLHCLIKPVIQVKSNHVKVDKHEVVVCVELEKRDPRDDDELIGVQRDLYTELTTDIEELVPVFYSQLEFLRKICIHPQHAFESMIEKPNLENICEEFSEKMDMMKAQNPVSVVYSAKIQLLMAMLADLKKSRPSEKAVVVSNSVELLKLIQSICLWKEINFKCVLYDGSKKERQRRRILESFNNNGNDIFILLLSCKSGGVGLDLSVANNLFLMDPDWNPANDKQALSRIYRPNQRNDCYIYRFLTTNTIEEVIFMNQLSKNEIELYYKGLDPHARHQSGYYTADLVQYHDAPHSFIKAKLDEMDSTNREISSSTSSTSSSDPDDSDTSGEIQGPNESVEFCQFAIELSESRQYRKKEDIPSGYLDTLRRCWDENGVTYAFHKFKGDDGTTSVLNIEEIFGTISDSEPDD